MVTRAAGSTVERMLSMLEVWDSILGTRKRQRRAQEAVWEIRQAVWHT